MSELTTPAFAAVAPYYEHLMSAVPYRFWLKHIERYWESVTSFPTTVLDLATGTGTVARLLAAQGKKVTGVDLSEAMLQTASEIAGREGLKIDWHRQDVCDLELPFKGFDTALCLFDSLNYILEVDRFRQAIHRVGSHVRPGGTFIFDMNTEFAFTLGMFNQSCSRREEPLHYRWRSRYDPESRICVVRMRFDFQAEAGTPVQTFREVHVQRAYDMEQVLGWLQEAGFGPVVVTDSFSDQPPYAHSDRLVYHALKN